MAQLSWKANSDKIRPFLLPTLLVFHSSRSQIHPKRNKQRAKKLPMKRRETLGKKFNLINWSKVLEDKNRGGLGIRDPGMMNQEMGDKMI